MNHRNCFVSYHHKRDQKYLDELRYIIGEMQVSDYSLKNDIGHLTDETIYKKIREKMRYCSITVILIGDRTGHRKWIDREIWASLRGYTHPYDQFKSFKPNGLLAIFLPTGTHSIPERLQDNIDSGFVITMKWKDIETKLEKKIADAFNNRTYKSHLIDNRRERQERDYFDFLGIKI